jgi:hypothetical protein
VRTQAHSVAMFTSFCAMAWSRMAAGAPTIMAMLWQLEGRERCPSRDFQGTPHRTPLTAPEGQKLVTQPQLGNINSSGQCCSHQKSGLCVFY